MTRSNKDSVETRDPVVSASSHTRYHFTEGTAVTVRTADGGRADIGPGWLAITEAEYAELAELQRYFGLRRAADMRAIERWRAEAAGRELRWPDHADMVCWLLTRWDTLRAKIAELEAEAWRPIETAPAGDLFDVWRGDQRIPDCELDARGRVVRKHGFPVITTFLQPQPSHWRPRPGAPGQPQAPARAGAGPTAEADLLSRLSPVDRAAVLAMVAERLRQVEVEGWSPKHDDEHDSGEMADAAAAYAYASTLSDRERGQSTAEAFLADTPLHGVFQRTLAHLWPWDWRWWKPRTPGRDLERAGALLIAELGRLTRAAAKESGGEDPEAFIGRIREENRQSGEACWRCGGLHDATSSCGGPPVPSARPTQKMMG